MGRNVYIGLFLVSLTTLTYELLLTRIWSVTMWYHFAFVAVSVTMFGMTVGAILVYLFPNFFSHDRLNHHLALSAFLFAAGIVFAFMTQACIPFVPRKSVMGLYLAGLTYGIASLPFCFCGICITLALTRFPRVIGKLYAANLAGAALGCFLLIGILEITDGITAVFVTALIASLGSRFFAVEAKSRRIVRWSTGLSIALFTFVGVNTVLVHSQRPLIRFMWVKGVKEGRPLYEKWNAFSRLTVTGDPDTPADPHGWGLSPIFKAARKLRQLWIGLDGFSQTIMTQFSGNLEDVEHLKYDVTNIAYYLRKGAKVLVIGAGGGRDVLSALAFGEKSVVAVDINEDMINIINGRYGDFTGHLDRDPRVSFVKDEARSWIARQTGKFDIIQISIIDTGIAAASGALALTENSLYTVEAWKTFLAHLKPDGIITCSRWYFFEGPGEIHRLLSVARTALSERGAKRPADHLVVVVHKWPTSEDEWPGAATLLVSREPFSARDLDLIDRVCEDLKFTVIQGPRGSEEQILQVIASGIGLKELQRDLPIRIDPPRDNSPFFFYMLRAKDVFSQAINRVGVSYLYTKAETILAQLLLVVILLTLACIFVPLYLTGSRVNLKSGLPFLVFFSGIGLGFMFIEISQMQRLIIFLGHPTYSLSVVLFALLLSSSLGSYLTGFVAGPSVRSSAIRRLIALLIVLCGYGFLTHFAIDMFQGASTPIRICIASAVMFPMGLFMGMAFPLGLRLASERCEALTPWLWGINGAMSVCASILAVAIAVTAGIRASFWTGAACYLISLFALARIPGSNGQTCGPQGQLEGHAPAGKAEGGIDV